MTRDVVCVHGYLAGGKASKLNFAFVTPALKKAGFRVHIPSLPARGIGDMDDNIQKVRSVLLSVAANSDSGKTHAIGHSLGALILHAYSKLYPEEAARILDKVIMLAGPHRGTKSVNRAKVAAIIAPLIFWPIGLLYLFSDSMRKMSYESDYIKMLAELPLPEGPEFHAIAARDDDKFYVSPWDSALHILGANLHIVADFDQPITIGGESVNIIPDHAGHVTMVTKTSVISTIVSILSN